MYINKDGKYYKQSLIEIPQEEILSLLNKQKIKLELESYNLGKPTCPEISIGDKEASDKIPQAWANNGNWYYNWIGAMVESKYLGKKIPTQKQWQEIVKDFGDDGKKISEELSLPFAGYRCWLNGYYNYQSINAYYWSSTPYSNDAYSLSFNTSHIYPAYYNSRGNGFSVRCLKD